MNFYQQKSLHNLHAVNVYHILVQNIIQCNYMKYYLQGRWEYVQTVLIHKYSYENTPVKDQKSEFILEYKQKFIRFELLHEVQQIDDQWMVQVSWNTYEPNPNAHE